MVKSKADRPTHFRAFKADADLALAMSKLEARDGISTSEMIRRALRRYLKAAGVYKERK